MLRAMRRCAAAGVPRSTPACTIYTRPTTCSTWPCWARIGGRRLPPSPTRPGLRTADCTIGASSAPSHLVVLEVPHRAARLDAASRLDVVGLPYVRFWEPDDALGFTALGTRPVTTEQERRLIRRYPRWR